MEKTKIENLIRSSGRSIKNGVHTTDVSNEYVADMMKEIAANAVCIGLYKFSGFTVSTFCNGQFKVDKSEWAKAKNDLYRYLTIIDNEGEYLKDILTTEEIDEAIEYTIFEKTSMGDYDE